MITVNNVQVPTLASEMTLWQFEHISTMLNNKHTDTIEKYIKVLTYWGVSKDYLNELSVDEFGEVIKSMNESNVTKTDYVREIELDGYTYRAYDEEFKLKVKDLQAIERCFRNEKYLCKMIAVIFKRTDLSDAEHYSESHIKHKAKLFKDINAEISIPYLTYVGGLFAKQLENAKTKLEQDNA
jgi:hypothetical protein